MKTSKSIIMLGYTRARYTFFCSISLVITREKKKKKVFRIFRSEGASVRYLCLVKVTLVKRIPTDVVSQ